MNKSKEQQLLRDPDIPPTPEVIAEGLGAANGAYEGFIAGLPGRDIQLEWRYYTDGMSWLCKGMYRWTGARGGQKEVCAFWLSIWEGLFKVTIYIPEKARTEALMLPLNEEIKQMITNAKQMGKLKFFPLVFDLRSDELLEAVYTLADFRKMLR